MVGIKLNGQHSYEDYGMILSSKNIEAPSVKSNKVDIKGGDGSLDLTEYFGEPKYKDRTLTFVFSKVHQTTSEFVWFWSRLQNTFNGKNIEIVLDEDLAFKYVGRCSLSYTKDKNIYQYKFKFVCEPYKLKVEPTVVKQTGSGDVVLENLRKKVCPSIKTTADTVLTFGTKVFNLSAGTWVLPELELISGQNTVNVSGTGTTTFTYTEGGL